MKKRASFNPKEYPPLPFAVKSYPQFTKKGYQMTQEYGQYPRGLYPTHSITTSFYSKSGKIGGKVYYKVMDMPTFCGGFHLINPHVAEYCNWDVAQNVFPKNFRFEQTGPYRSVTSLDLMRAGAMLDLDLISGRTWPSNYGLGESTNLYKYLQHSIIQSMGAYASIAHRINLVGVDHSYGVLWPFIKLFNEYGPAYFINNNWQHSFIPSNAARIAGTLNPTAMTHKDLANKIRTVRLKEKYAKHVWTMTPNATKSQEIKNLNSSNMCSWINFSFKEMGGEVKTLSESYSQEYSEEVLLHISKIMNNNLFIIASR